MSMLKAMKSYAHLKPGQRGTLRLVEKYGKALLCVRYRYDEARGVKLKTVEIIVDEKPLRHPRFNVTRWCRYLSLLMRRNCANSSKKCGDGGIRRSRCGLHRMV
jgi:hypothetical protein